MEMQNCGLTDDGGRSIIDFLNFNKTMIVFDVRNNEKLSENVLNYIRKQFGMEPEEDYDANGEIKKKSSKVEIIKMRYIIVFFLELKKWQHNFIIMLENKYNYWNNSFKLKCLIAHR